MLKFVLAMIGLVIMFLLLINLLPIAGVAIILLPIAFAINRMLSK